MRVGNKGLGDGAVVLLMLIGVGGGRGEGWKRID
jgi:hypothetical protein